MSAAREDLAILHAHQASIDPQTYLVSLGWKRLISYQPADRFWTFQILEGGLFLALVGGDPGRGALAHTPDAGVTIELDRATMLRLGVAAAAGSRSRTGRRSRDGGFLDRIRSWRIVFVNHALTNPFFVPAKYGSEDAATLLGVRTEWTGR